MPESKLTLIDAFNQFWTAAENSETSSLRHTGCTYFYLVNIWNVTGRSVSFRRQNNLICAQVGISYLTLDRHRKVLLKEGLIDYFSNGSGDPNICYKILRFTTQKKGTRKQHYDTSEEVPEDVKNQHSGASPKHSSSDSGDAYKQSKSTEKEKEFFVIVKGEKKIFKFFEEFFTTDAGIQAGYAEQGLPAAKFTDALKQWMIQNHGKTYADIQEARKHFLFWLPFYQNQKSKNHVYQPSIKKNNFHGRKTFEDYAEGL